MADSIPGILDTRIRRGPRPRTLPRAPHSQLDQNAPRAMYDAVAEYMFSKSGVRDCPSVISVPGARAMCVDPACCIGPRAAFMVGTEFAHLHPPSDASLHVCLPPQTARKAIDAGWAEPHVLAHQMGNDSLVMLYGPRDHDEIEVVRELIDASLAFATTLSPSSPR